MIIGKVRDDNIIYNWSGGYIASMNNGVDGKMIR